MFRLFTRRSVITTATALAAGTILPTPRALPASASTPTAEPHVTDNFTIFAMVKNHTTGETNAIKIESRDGHILMWPDLRDDGWTVPMNPGVCNLFRNVIESPEGWLFPERTA